MRSVQSVSQVVHRPVSLETLDVLDGPDLTQLDVLDGEMDGNWTLNWTVSRS